MTDNLHGYSGLRIVATDEDHAREVAASLMRMSPNRPNQEKLPDGHSWHILYSRNPEDSGPYYSVTVDSNDVFNVVELKPRNIP